LEVTKVKARQHFARSVPALVFGLLIQGSIGELEAQQQTVTRGQVPGPRFMVPVFRSNERGIGAQFADQLRERMGGDFMGRTLWIIVKSDIESALVQSGYSTTEAVNSNDARQLANIVRAEEYVEGAINKTGTGFEFTGVHLLVRGEGMVQPLPKVTGEKLGDVAKGVSNALRDARKPIEEVKNCVLKWRQNQYPGAIADATKGIREYPNSVMSRVCLLEVAASQKWGADSLIKIGEQVTALHPDNRRALALLADAYGEKKQDDKYISTLTKLLAADPTNTRLGERVIEAIAATGQFEVAKPIIDTFVKQNPGDPALTRMQYRIYVAVKDYAGAAVIGEEMIKTDTAAADTSFFTRQAGAYVFAGDTAKALETASRGAQKFQNNVGLWTLVAQFSRQTGQMPQALIAIEKIVALDPKTPGINLQKAVVLNGMNQTDQAVEALKAAVAAGDDKAQVAGVANSIAGKLFTQYGETKDKAVALRGLDVLKVAEEAGPTNATFFLKGALNLQLGVAALQEAQPAKSCDLSRQAKDYFTEAEINIPKGGAQFGAQIQQLMPTVQQYGAYPDQMIKAYCK
jgi:tetratricopeptide (TPR) repeat protein